MILNSVRGIGPITLSRLMEKFGDDPWEILSASPHQLSQVKGVGKQLIHSVSQVRASGWLEKEKQKLEKIGGNFLDLSKLPTILQQLPDAPIGLYCLGQIPDLPCVSIVGTRVPSNYGKKFARKIAYELAQSGFCIVSGMARGIDTEAHLGALEAGGRTMAFLGTGIDVVYPPENFDLYKNIVKNGAVLSEFPLGRRADRRTFPMRNRLVAGCSLAVLVIESAQSGGSMITAKFAAEQGRTVFALPGRVDLPESRGCLDLIRDGATLVRNALDIIEELAPMLGSMDKKPLSSQTTKQLNPSSELDKNERLIIELFRGGDRLGIEDIQQSTAIEMSKVAPSLSMLEIKGLILKCTDGKYEINT